MKITLTKTAFAVGMATALLLPGMGHAQTAAEKKVNALYEAAKKEGEVIWYTTSRKAYTKNLSKFWKKRFPDVKLKILRKNSPKLVQTFEAEVAAGKPRPDVISMSAPYISQIWLDRGLYDPYKPTNFDKIDPRFKDPNGHWTSRAVFLLLGAYNTNLIKDKKVLPTQFKDLLDPKWKDKLLSAHPETAGSSRTFFATVVKKNIAGGWKFLEQLGKQNLFYTTGNSGAARMVVAGERPLAVAISSHNIVVAMDKGQAINWFAYKDGAIINHSPMGILKTATHKNGAKLLIEFTYTKEGQDQVANWARQWGSMDGAPSPKGLPPLKSFNLVAPDLAWLVKSQKEFLEKFGQYMGKRS